MQGLTARMSAVWSEGWKILPLLFLNALLGRLVLKLSSFLRSRVAAKLRRSLSAVAGDLRVELRALLFAPLDTAHVLLRPNGQFGWRTLRYRERRSWWARVAIWHRAWRSLELPRLRYSGPLNPPRGRICRNAGLHSSISRT